MTYQTGIHAALRLALGHVPTRVLLWAFIGGLLALMAYCLGHGLFTSAPIEFVASLRWSIAHATGIGLIGLAAYRMRQQPWFLRFFVALFAGLAGSVLVAGIGLHSYVSAVCYLVLASAASELLAPAVEGAWLELDFGRSRRIAAPRQIIAVHGARNYAQVEIEGAVRPGLARMTLEGMLHRHSTRLVRVHRSHLVDPRRIVGIRVAPRGALTVQLTNGSEVPVSPRYAAAVRALAASFPAGGDSSHTASGAV